MNERTQAVGQWHNTRRIQQIKGEIVVLASACLGFDLQVMFPAQVKGNGSCEFIACIPQVVDMDIPRLMDVAG
jgi:hypothetical protein